MTEYGVCELTPCCTIFCVYCMKKNNHDSIDIVASSDGWHHVEVTVHKECEAKFQKLKRKFESKYGKIR